MTEVPIPGTDQEIDTDDDASTIVITIVSVLAGLALLVWLYQVAQNLASEANSTIASLIGYDPTSGESADSGGAFD